MAETYFGRGFGESILDRPKDGMDPDVWAVNADGEYVPTTYASKKIDAVVQWASARFGITDPVVHITGSIASNSYGSASDVDLHFSSGSFRPEDPDAFNKEFRKAFELEFSPETGEENGRIGVHPIEVYWQENPFQDMMSVGCYDYLGRKWESGPDIKDTAFDPYSEYYEKDMKYVGRLAGDVRNQVLETYEKALVMKKASDLEFKEALSKKLLKSLKDAASLFASIRNKRRVMSSPKSKEEALKMRGDRKWHIADSAFKLFDKFGYLEVLRAYTRLSEQAEAGSMDADAVADGVVSAVVTAMDGSKMLTDSELAVFGLLAEGDVPGMPDASSEDIKARLEEWLSDRIPEYGLDIRVKGLALHGSRTRKDFGPDSDLDVIVYYEGSDGENAVWNSLNDDPKCEIEGVTVDFWPTRDEESGTLEDTLKRSEEYGMRYADSVKAWVDDVRPAPEGYVWFRSVNDFIGWYEDSGAGLAVLDIDHDAGKYAADGGDYIKILDYLESKGLKELRIRIHSMNPAGAENMRRVVRRNGWQEYSGLDEADVDEGLGSALRNAAFAGMMLAPGVAAAKDARPDQARRPAVVQRAPEKKYGRLSASKMKNLLATIAYNETMLDWIKYRDDDEIIAILNTIQTRAGGDPNYYAFVISERSQYFSAKHVKGGYDDATYKTYDPNDEAKAEGGALSRSQKECWRLCQEYAQQMLDGKLKNVIGDRNMIGNRKKDTDKTAVGPNGWGKDCDLEIGGQRFGYKAEWDGYKRFGKRKPAELTHNVPARTQPNYVVKSGDTLWQIAKANNTTVQKLKKGNGLKTDAIRPGQKLVV